MKDKISETKIKDRKRNKTRELDSWLEGWEQWRNRARDQERCPLTALIGGAKKAIVVKRRKLHIPEDRSKYKKFKYSTLED